MRSKLYLLVIWCVCMTGSMQIDVKIKTNQFSIKFEDIQNNLFWGFVYRYMGSKIQQSYTMLKRLPITIRNNTVLRLGQPLK